MENNTNKAMNSLRYQAFGLIEGIFSLIVGIATLGTNRLMDSEVICDGR
jgi:hypothetical protein